MLTTVSSRNATLSTGESYIDANSFIRPFDTRRTSRSALEPTDGGGDTISVQCSNSRTVRPAQISVSRHIVRSVTTADASARQVSRETDRRKFHCAFVGILGLGFGPVSLHPFVPLTLRCRYSSLLQGASCADEDAVDVPTITKERCDFDIFRW